MTKPKYNLTGQRFGMLTVVGYGDAKRGGRNLWTCVCDCGNTCHVDSYSLRFGDTVSCGCKRRTHNVLAHKAQTRHGMSKTRLYKTWQHMLRRCDKNSNAPEYRRYRELGISVCDEWKNCFEAFRDWATETGYQDDLTIDRIDVYGDYEPANCRWATMKQQLNNTRANVRYTWNGETHTAQEWSDITGIPAQRIRYRIRAGWPKENIFDSENHQKNPIRKWWR